MGENEKQAFQLSFNRFLRVAFQGSRVTSEARFDRSGDLYVPLPALPLTPAPLDHFSALNFPLPRFASRPAAAVPRSSSATGILVNAGQLSYRARLSNSR